SSPENFRTRPYKILKNAGFIDLWQYHSSEDGFTCCQNERLKNSKSFLNKRVDFVWINHPDENFYIDDIEMILLGVEKHLDHTGEIWPSNHAGIFAEFKIVL
ncbi:MAG: hypothetical protein OXB84_00730, partial [Halobacteriovoraceae bacterium]|nr:hypothetical protein [Halobacteriovoraceae bacterium]